MAECQAYLSPVDEADRLAGAMARTPNPHLANRLVVARAERRLSQSELGVAVGVSRQTISSIETGQYCPSALLAFRLAEALGVPIEGLFWLEGGTT